MRNDTGLRLTGMGHDSAPAPADNEFPAPVPPVTPELTYSYDGTFDGWLCCVCESYEKKEIPGKIRALPGNDINNYGLDDIISEELFTSKTIETRQDIAARVRNGITEKIGNGFLRLLERVFCSCIPEKEEQMLLFTHKGFRYGMRILNLRQDPVVCSVHKGLRDLGREIDKWYGFVRFSDMHGILVAVIGAKNNVLPFIARHFTDRFHNERFMIFDGNHQMALVYRPGRCAIVPVESFSMAEAGEEEKLYRTLWQNYYEAIEIKPRHNETCRRNLMPKRYWEYLTEMAGRNKEESK